jgi:hypothetical protein
MPAYNTTLTEEQIAFVKSMGRGYLGDLVQTTMDRFEHNLGVKPTEVKQFIADNELPRGYVPPRREGDAAGMVRLKTTVPGQTDKWVEERPSLAEEDS